jgi:ER membrane protein complex subunit 2
VTLLLQCCGHINNSKAVVSKRKDSQKLAQWCLGQIKDIKATNATDKKMLDSEMAAMESAFGSLDVKATSN